MNISTATEKEWALGLRIPGWCKKAEVRVNGEKVCINDKITVGYALIQRVWKDGDSVELVLEMPVLRMKANPMVRADIGKVALQRGPMVYCLEESDNGSNLHEVILPEGAEMKVGFDKELLGGVSIITTDAQRVNQAAWGNDLYKADASVEVVPAKLKFIPYFAWANREIGEMTVWVAEK